MALVEIYAQDFTEISNVPASSFIRGLDKAPSEGLRQQDCREILACMVRHSCYLVLNNNTHVKNIGTFAHSGYAPNGSPQMKSAELEEICLYGPFKLSQVSTDESLSYLRNSNIPIRTFYDIDEGLAWLNTASDSFASKPGKANEVNSD